MDNVLHVDNAFDATYGKISKCITSNAQNRNKPSTPETEYVDQWNNITEKQSHCVCNVCGIVLPLLIYPYMNVDSSSVLLKSICAPRNFLLFCLNSKHHMAKILTLDRENPITYVNQKYYVCVLV